MGDRTWCVYKLGSCDRRDSHGWFCGYEVNGVDDYCGHIVDLLWITDDDANTLYVEWTSRVDLLLQVTNEYTNTR
jgi:hypothetical protein